MCDDAVDLQPFGFDSKSIVSLLKVVRIVLQDVDLVPRSTEATAVLESRRFIHIKLTLEGQVTDGLVNLQLQIQHLYCYGL